MQFRSPYTVLLRRLLSEVGNHIEDEGERQWQTILAEDIKL